MEKAEKELVTIHKLSQDMGISECAIRGRISTGFWVEGKHYYRKRKRPGGRPSIMMDKKACNQSWID